MIRPKKRAHKKPPKGNNPINPPPIASLKPRFPLRLNRYIALCGVCARRKADEHISQGHVQLNGLVETRMGVQVEASDKVLFKGKALQLNPYTYLLLNKPKACITTQSDPQGRRTVFDLLGEAGKGLVAVGRLDSASTGLLLFTNDGELSQRLSHPSGNLHKVYSIRLDKALSSESLHKLQSGLELEDGRFCPDKVALDESDATRLAVTIHSGRNRILRRVFEALGHEVVVLDRVAYGPLTKKHLPRGKWRALSGAELHRLQSMQST